MQTTMVSVLVAVAALGQASRSPIPKTELDYQKQVFQQWWGQDLTLKLSDLPNDGAVPSFRVPYSGYDYPDHAGGTIQAMVKYDSAYHSGRGIATGYERNDVSGHRDRDRPQPIFGRRIGLFGRIREYRIVQDRSHSRSWYGHCNGWTAASIRHAEPQFSVRRNGVLFTPADIKGMLAEIYMYTDTEFLGGVDPVIHPAVFHLSMTNWLGRGSHPIGVETAVGEVVINYPIYNYKSTVTKRSEREAEVKMTVQYAMNTNREAQKSPRIAKQMYFHYLLDLDDSGAIIGGRYYNDSSRIDMLWAPLKPIQGGKKGNERGNPHLNVKEVLAIWRDSVPEELRNQWLNIDPTEEDRILSEEEQLAAASPPASSPAPATATPSEPPTTTSDAPAAIASNSPESTSAAPVAPDATPEAPMPSSDSPVTSPAAAPSESAPSPVASPAADPAAPTEPAPSEPAPAPAEPVSPASEPDSAPSEPAPPANEPEPAPSEPAPPAGEPEPAPSEPAPPAGEPEPAEPAPVPEAPAVEGPESP